MLRVLSLKLLSGETSSFSSKTFAFFSHPTTGSYKHHGFLSKYSTFSFRQQNRVFSDKIPYGFFTNPVFAKRLLRNTSFKGQRQDLFDRAVRFFRNRTPGRLRLSPDDVVMWLIATNVGVFMLWRIADTEFMRKNFTISVDNFKSGRIHTLITSAFSHKDIGHLFSNMVGLYFFGTSMGTVFGPQFMLKVYLAGALTGSIFFVVYHAYMSSLSKERRMFGFDHSKIPGLGASGAVNAIMLLDIFLFPKKTIAINFILPVPAALLGFYLIVNDMLHILEGDSRISGSAHLGGAAVAGVTWLLIRKGRFRF